MVAGPQGEPGGSARLPDLAEPVTGVKTVEKSLRILELLLAAEQELTIGQIVDRTGMHRASVQRALTTLHALGWVERPAVRPVYRLSLRLYALAHVFTRNYDLLARLQPLLVELSVRSRETAHLGILDGWQVLHLGRQESPQRVGVTSPIGSRGWAHTSGMGKALLAGRPDAFLHAYIAATGLPGLTAHSLTTPEAFLAEMAMVRSQGYSIDDEEDSIGVRCLGAALPVAHGPAVLAVSITGPSPRFTQQCAHEFAPALLDLISRVSGPGLIIQEVIARS